MARRSKPKSLSETDVAQLLADCRRLIDTINRVSVRTDSAHYRAIDDLRDALFNAARTISGSDRPWPVYSSLGPC